MTDYPAAHSMDTEWFAMDSEGHVGVFDTGENGHVPLRALQELRDIEKLISQIPERAPLEWILSQLPDDRQHCHERGCSVTTWPVVMLLSAIEFVHDELRDAEYDPDNMNLTILETNAGVGILWRECPEKRYQELHAAGACLGCYQPEEIDVRDFLFEYSFTSRSYEYPVLNNLYALRWPPEVPLLLKAIPPEIQQELQSRLIHFTTTRFPDSEFVQPLEFAPCCGYGNRTGQPHSYNFWWLAYYDHQAEMIRPIKGREIEYQQRFEDLRLEADSRGLKIEPPSSRTNIDE